MDISQLLVNLISVAFIAWIVWYFWLYRKEGVQVTDVAGVQEVPITVRGGYDPDYIVVKQGKPVRLLFTRQESSLCSEMVVLDKINQSAKLPEGKTVAIEFTPERAGEIAFQCQMGMLRGKIIVNE
jgi:plastocyanin domain-containing protein